MDGEKNILIESHLLYLMTLLCNNINQTALGAVQRFFSKNPRLLWKWVGGSMSHSEFF